MSRTHRLYRKFRVLTGIRHMAPPRARRVETPCRRGTGFQQVLRRRPALAPTHTRLDSWLRRVSVVRCGPPARPERAGAGCGRVCRWQARPSPKGAPTPPGGGASDHPRRDEAPPTELPGSGGHSTNQTYPDQRISRATRPRDHEPLSREHRCTSPHPGVLGAQSPCRAGLVPRRGRR